MNGSDVAFLAEELVESYRELLLIDPFFKIGVEIGDGDFISTCKPSSSPLSWKITLNAVRHVDAEDIQYSVVEGLLAILFHEMPDDSKHKKKKNALIARLSTAISNLLPVDFAEEDDVLED